MNFRPSPKRRTCMKPRHPGRPQMKGESRARSTRVAFNPPRRPRAREQSALQHLEHGMRSPGMTAGGTAAAAAPSPARGMSMELTTKAGGGSIWHFGQRGSHRSASGGAAAAAACPPRCARRPPPPPAAAPNACMRTCTTSKEQRGQACFMARTSSAVDGSGKLVLHVRQRRLSCFCCRPSPPCAVHTMTDSVLPHSPQRPTGPRPGTGTLASATGRRCSPTLSTIVAMRDAARRKTGRMVSRQSLTTPGRSLAPAQMEERSASTTALNCGLLMGARPISE